MSPAGSQAGQERVFVAVLGMANQSGGPSLRARLPPGLEAVCFVVLLVKWAGGVGWPRWHRWCPHSALVATRPEAGEGQGRAS